jgi:competence protein ComEA
VADLASWPAVARVLTGTGALLLAAAGAWWLLRAPAPPVEAALPRATTTVPASTTAGPPAAAAPQGTVVVQAAGAVVHPGVYRLPGGSRVLDLVEAAGGPAEAADLEALPLAALLVDGQRVQVPREGEPVPPSAVVDTTPTAAAPLDLNAATVDQLDVLPGVGPATAQAIVAHRTRVGRFRQVDDLLDVPGIGPAKLEAFRALVRV